MTNIQTLTLLPQDQLVLVHSVELQAALHYRRLALRLITYNTALSRQMTECGIACEQRLKTLKDIAETLGLGACVRMHEKHQIQESAWEPGKTFFIINEEMAAQALRQALTKALETHSFARQLLGANGTPELERALWDYAQHKQYEANILTHCCTGQLQRA